MSDSEGDIDAGDSDCVEFEDDYAITMSLMEWNDIFDHLPIRYKRRICSHYIKHEERFANNTYDKIQPYLAANKAQLADLYCAYFLQTKKYDLLEELVQLYPEACVKDNSYSWKLAQAPIKLFKLFATHGFNVYRLYIQMHLRVLARFADEPEFAECIIQHVTQEDLDHITHNPKYVEPKDPSIQAMIAAKMSQN